MFLFVFSKKLIRRTGIDYSPLWKNEVTQSCYAVVDMFDLYSSGDHLFRVHPAHLSSLSEAGPGAD